MIVKVVCTFLICIELPKAIRMSKGMESQSGTIFHRRAVPLVWCHLS